MHYNESRIFFARCGSLKHFAALSQLKFVLLPLQCFSVQLLRLRLPGLTCLEPKFLARNFTKTTINSANRSWSFQSCTHFFLKHAYASNCSPYQIVPNAKLCQKFNPRKDNDQTHLTARKYDVPVIRHIHGTIADC